MKLKITLLLLVSLFFLFYSCNKEPGPSETTEPKPQELSLNVIYNGSISEVGEVDKYIFEPNEDYYIHLVCKEGIQNSELTPQIKLFDFTTKVLIAEVSDETQAVILNYLAEAGKTYEIQVLEFWGNKTGSYSLKIQEDTDDGVLFSQTPAYHYGAIDYIKDKDDLFFKSSSGGSFKLVLAERIPNSSYNPDIAIYDQYNNLLNSTGSYDSCVVNNLNFEAGITYKLHVWDGIPPSGPGEYLLRIEDQ